MSTLFNSLLDITMQSYDTPKQPLKPANTWENNIKSSSSLSSFSYIRVYLSFYINIYHHQRYGFIITITIIIITGMHLCDMHNNYMPESICTFINLFKIILYNTLLQLWLHPKIVYLNFIISIGWSACPDNVTSCMTEVE